MKYRVFAKRNLKEILRDPTSIIFGLALPIILLLLISTIQKKTAVPIFALENFTPAIAVFSFSFITLFSGMLIASDRSSSFLTRLFVSPMTAKDYILGYLIPFLPIALLQSIICFLFAIIIGLQVSINILYTLIALIPVASLFIAFGLLLGTIFKDKQIGPVASVLVQVTALSSGMWFDLNLLGSTVKNICYAMPFAHSIDLVRYTLSGNYNMIAEPLIWVLGYTAIILFVAIWLFKRKMRY